MEQIKHEIRNVLVSCKVPLTIKELGIQYKLLTGKGLQFQKFGYPDFECLLMDIPDVISTIWLNGELRLLCKRDTTDIVIEAQVNVLKHSKKSQKRPNYVSSRTIRTDIFVPRVWQDSVEKVLKENGGQMPIMDLIKQLDTLRISFHRNHLTVIGALKNSWNFKINDQEKSVELRYADDILIKIVLQVLDLYPEGIQLEKFKETFQRHLKRKINLEIYGFRTFHELFLYYSELVTISVHNNGYLTIFSTKHRLKINPLQWNESKEIMGKITCVNSPSSFWFVPLENEAIETVENEIRYIKEKINELSIDIGFIAPGKIVLAETQKNENTFGRALVLEISSKVKLLFIDYGYVDSLDPSHIYSIPPHSPLNKIPRLATHAKLAYVTPKGNIWSEESINYFHSCVDDCHLVITLTSKSVPPVPVTLIRYCRSINIIKSNKYVANIAVDMANYKYLTISET